MKRLLTNLRIAGTGAGRMVIAFAAVLLLIYLALTLFCGWSDRRVLGTILFYRDLRYWPGICTALLWIGTGAIAWRIAAAVAYRRFKQATTNRFRLSVPVSFDVIGRIGTLVFCGIALYRNGLTVSRMGAGMVFYWHWLFDPIGVFILQGPGSSSLKGIPLTRFLWLPGIIALIGLVCWYLARYTIVFHALRQLVARSWMASFASVALLVVLLPMVGSLLTWFTDGFYRVPVTLVMTTGTITWPLFVIPGLFSVFVLIIALSRRKRSIKTLENEEIINE